MGLTHRTKGMYLRKNGKWSLDKVVGGHRIAMVLDTRSETTAARILKKEIEKIPLFKTERPCSHTSTVHANGLRLGEVIELYQHKGMDGIKSEIHKDNRLQALFKLRDFLGSDKIIGEISSADIIKYRNTYTVRHRKPSYINHMVYLAASSLFRFVREVLEISSACRINWKLIKLPVDNMRTRSLSMQEQESLNMVLLDKDRYVHMFAIKTGLRASEIINLKWCDVNYKEGKIIAIVKGGRVHKIPISKEIGKILAAVANDHTEYVFTYEAHRFDLIEKKILAVRLPLTYRVLSARARIAFRAAGIKDYRLHDHRHTCATRLYKETRSVKIVQKVLGHLRASSCDRYIHAYDEDVLEAFESLDRSEHQTQVTPFTFGVSIEFDSMKYLSSIHRYNDNRIEI